MKGIVKVIVGLVVVLVVVLIIAVVGVLMYVNDIAKAGIEKGGTYALGVETTVESVRVGLLAGEFGMKGYRSAQPAGFGDSTFFGMGNAEVALTIGSLRSDTVEIPYLNLHDVELTLVKNDKGTNHQAVLDHLASISGPKEDKPETTEEDAPPSKKFIIRKID